MLKCKYGCNCLFKTAAAMEAHRKDSHPARTPAVKTGKAVSATSPHNPNMLMCRYGCNCLFKTAAALDAHRKDSHPARTPAVKTGKEVSATSPHNPNMLMCRYGCNSLFKTAAALDAHRKDSHPGATSSRQQPASKKTAVAACNDCGQTFSSVDALRQHQLTKAEHIRPAREVGSSCCGKCNRALRSQDSLEQHFVEDHSLIQIATGNSMRTQLEGDFKLNWRKPSRVGQVLNVFRVYNPGWRYLQFQQYKQHLRNGGNEVMRYHGTTLLCNLGSVRGDSNHDSKLCQNVGCNLCSILRTGFKTAKARDRWQRFGKGIYTTATSGKSDDYIRSSSGQRAVLVCQVLAGNVLRTQTNMPTLEAPPQGYDSVSGEVGKDLNYDETVVYSSKAILPSYMIVYTTK